MLLWDQVRMVFSVFSLSHGAIPSSSVSWKEKPAIKN